jgi:hypothetical protein
MGRFALIVAVTSLIAVTAAGIGLPSASARSCGTVAAPGYHAFEVTTRGITCRAARRLLKSWLEDDAKPSGGPRGWRCKKSFARPWRCTRRGDVITFIFHSY